MENQTSPVDMSDIGAFVCFHSAWMLPVAQRILQDKGYAEDAVQTGFAKIFANIDTFEGRSSLKTWMQRIVVNEALSSLRRINGRQEDSIDDLLPEFDGAACRIHAGASQFMTAEVLLQRTQTHATVKAAIHSLPEKYRVVLCLRDIEELSTSEVIAALGISETNVKVRLHRARAALKKLLEPLHRGVNL
jgi:RNA polymerase sigma-70 factor (ECF subfamily)